MKHTSNIQSEYSECLALTHYLELLKTQGKIKVFSHIANETFTKSWVTKMKNKAMGVRPGMPDYIIIANRHIIFIEMKRVSGGKLSDYQKTWLEALQALDLPAHVCKGFEDAKQTIERYI